MSLDTLIGELRAAGYEVGIASGCVKTEESALSEAEGLAAPERIEADVQEIANKAAIDAQALAATRGIRNGDRPRAIAEAVTRVTAQALEAITTARSDRVAFHERAVEIAKSMPTTLVVSGPGFTNLYVNVDDATGEGADESSDDVLRSLRDPALVSERFKWTARLEGRDDETELVQRVNELRGKGYTVQPEIGDDGKTIRVRILDGDGVETVAASALKLRDAAETLPDLATPAGG